MAVAVIQTIAAKQCQSANTSTARTGHRCVTASEQYTAITNVPSHLCTHICMRQGNCSVINYNHEKRYYQLTSEDCQELIKDSEFTVTSFSCWAEWVPVAKAMDKFRVPCAKNSEYSVGRVVVQADILVGTHTRWTTYTHVSKNGTRVSSRKGEVLQMQPWCSVHWTPYIPGNTIPVGAVVGGYLGNPSNTTYVISGKGKRSCGYYNPDTQLGYIVFPWSKIATNMDILVLRQI